jgi:hypothetical protein
MVRTVGEAYELLHGRQGLTPIQWNTATNREQTIRGFFDANYDMFTPVFPIGSYQRGSICAGERDIDLMACLRGYGTERLRPRFEYDSSQFLYWIRNNLNAHYHRTDVSSKQVCVKLDFTDIVTDVTPCFAYGSTPYDGYIVPNGRGGWMRTNPRFHADLIADADQSKGGKLLPIIRLLKAWNVANGHHLSSFHLEMLVEAAQRPYNIYWHSFEVWWTLRSLSWRVLSSFYDPWAPGGRIDSYLTDNERARVGRMLTLASDRAEQAREYESRGMMPQAFERWNLVYNGTFPTYG